MLCSLLSCLFYTLLLGELTLSKKMNIPDFDTLKSKNLNECQRCKVLTDSFMHWLDKTSRGKFEGGDAAWEETKLRGYARSEVRLVEIQEGLCSELKKNQDQCYSLAEDSEQALEKWWFHEDPGSDLYTWLCIETLQHCCPRKHFGDNCKLCPLDKKNNVCGERGTCDGDGTRMGTGTCLCKRGYIGELCESCAQNYYDMGGENCAPCHKACDGCSGQGPMACKVCSRGWQEESGVCVDINECLNPSICKSHQYCINKEGFHACEACDKSCKTCSGPGSSNCTSCGQNLVLWSNICLDTKLKLDLTKSAFSRLALYFGLLLITFFIYRKSLSLASVIVLIVAVYIYFSEKVSKMNITDVIMKMYL